MPSRTRRSSAVTLLAALALLPAAAAAQPTVGQVDDFEDGSTANWQVNLIPGNPPHPSPPANVADGGPMGAGDNFMLLTAVGGSGGPAPEPGSRLAVINFGNQWAGNYTAAGITHIQFDANNLGGTELMLRLVFEDPALDFSGPPCNMAVSSAPIALASGSDWTTLLFPLHGPGGLTHFATGIPGCAPGGSLESLLANTTAIRIIHNPDFAPNGSPVVAQLGVDNITAVQVVPEPATVLLVGSGALVLLAVGRRRVRR